MLKRINRKRITLIMPALFLICSAARAQIHGVQIGTACESPRCVNETTDCRTIVAQADGFGDTFMITAVWHVIEPTTLNIRVPAVGNLPIASIEGNAFCSDGGGTCQSDGTGCDLPCYVGAPFSTLSGLPGASLPGVIQFREDQYVIQPSDPNPLHVKSNMDVHDVCDSPTTQGCSTLPGLLQFTAVASWCGDSSPACGGCHLQLQSCMAGPASAPDPAHPFVAADCLEAFDLNLDTRVDLLDFAILQVEYVPP